MSRRIIFGPRASHNLEQTGGIVVLFELYIDYLNSKGVPLVLVDTNRKNHTSTFAYVITVLKWLVKARAFSVIEFHVTARDIITIVVPFHFVSSTHNRIVVRKFAGNFDEWYCNQCLLVKKVVLRALSRANLVFFETKQLIHFFHRQGIHSQWWPNVRKANEELCPRPKKNLKGKILFLSQIKRSKGIIDAVACIEGLSERFTLDVYGPLVEPDLETIFKKKSQRVSYNGVVNPEEVRNVMRKYDLLMFPSIHPGEGYPGVVIEAKSVGLPIVCYKHGALGEIVTNGIDGFVLRAGDVEGMIMCVEGLDDRTYRRMSKNSLASFQIFNSDIIHEDMNWKILLTEYAKGCYKP